MSLDFNKRAGEINAEADCVTVILADVKGSAPREVGAQMIVYEAATEGSIGGGSLEHQAIAQARQMLTAQASGVRSPEACTQLLRNTLNTEFDQCCGGAVVLLFEYVPADQRVKLASKIKEYEQNGTAYCQLRVASYDQLLTSASRLVSSDEVTPANSNADPTITHAIDIARNLLRNPPADKPHFLAKLAGSEDKFGSFSLAHADDFNLSLFGAGHVGRALVSTLALHSCKIRWIDSRADIFPTKAAPNVEYICSSTPAAEVADAPAASYFLVMTHSHELDYELCDHILARDNFQFLGLIGSKSKALHFRKQFAKQGLDASEIDKITCPIGIDGIGSKHPSAIAISIAAQLLQLRECR